MFRKKAKSEDMSIDEMQAEIASRAAESWETVTKETARANLRAAAMSLETASNLMASVKGIYLGTEEGDMLKDASTYVYKALFSLGWAMHRDEPWKLPQELASSMTESAKVCEADMRRAMAAARSRETDR